MEPTLHLSNTLFEDVCARMGMVSMLPSLYVVDVEIVFKVAEESAKTSRDGSDRPYPTADLP